MVPPMIDITGVLDPNAKTSSGEKISLHKQLVERLQQAILSGRLPADTRLSSSRTLATELGVSRNTVVLAYEHLAAEGYIIADQQGTKVASLSAQSARIRSVKKAQTTPVTLAKRWHNLADSKPTSDIKQASLTPGIPALDHFPIAAWRRSLERTTKQLHRQSLLSHEPLGVPALKQSIANHLHIARGVKCEPNQIVITAGAQQALDLCLALITNPEETVWIEDPCYFGAKSALNIRGLTVVSIPVDKEGIDAVNATQATHTHPPKLIFTTPAHQYPTGAVLSVTRRLALIEYAQKIGAWIIEDDYDGDFRHFGSPIASMQGLIEDAPVIYIGSFSKTLFPALRIGFMVLPKNLMNQASPILETMLSSGNQLQQLALADFMTSGEFGRHLGRMRRVYRERQKVLKAALVQYFPHDWILGGSAGMHLTLMLPADLNDKSIAETANRQGIGVTALSTYYSNTPAKRYGLVIGYGNTDKEKIIQSIATLAKIIHAHSSH